MEPDEWHRRQRALIDAPVIDAVLYEQLMKVEPSGDGSLEYRRASSNFEMVVCRLRLESLRNGSLMRARTE
jgi:hypothetical protein